MSRCWRPSSASSARTWNRAATSTSRPTGQPCGRDASRKKWSVTKPGAQDCARYSRRLHRMEVEMPELATDYDVVVVGSGFGGSVTALRLTEKGYRVGVLGAGSRFTPRPFPEHS